MSYRRDLARELFSTAINSDSATPGRGTRTSELVGPVMRRASGLVARAAERDDNGVAADAGAKLDAAANCTGASLPAPVQRKFEGSLGADLSGVRVHTGAESANAADAVGAKAYTVGQDIHFGAGHYNPSSQGGEHLLAHEVAHTVQQKGGTPARQNKLEVSGPGDASEHEADRAADAMVGGAPAIIGSNSGLARQVIQREGNKNAQGNSPPDPGSTPFDLSTLPPDAVQQIDQLTLDSLRALTNAQIGRAHSDYLVACLEAKTRLGAQKAARIAAEQKLVDIALGAVGMVLGPAGAAIGSSLGPVVSTAVQDRVAAGVPGLLAKLNIPPSKALGVTVAINQRVAQLATKVDASVGKAIVSGATSKLAAMTCKVNSVGTYEDITCSYLDGVMSSADQSCGALLTAVATNTDVVALASVCAEFQAATLDVYRADVGRRADDFSTQIAPTIGGGSNSNLAIIAIVNAYGRPRMCTLRYDYSQAGYHFVSWVTPEMEASAASTNPTTVAPTAIIDHIPDPNDEGAVYGQEVIRTTNAYGRQRLVVVKANVGIISNTYGEIDFVRWVAPEDETKSRVVGDSQIGGITPIDSSRISGLQPPPDVQLAKNDDSNEQEDFEML